MPTCGTVYPCTKCGVEYSKLSEAISCYSSHKPMETIETEICDNCGHVLYNYHIAGRTFEGIGWSHFPPGGGMPQRGHCWDPEVSKKEQIMHQGLSNQQLQYITEIHNAQAELKGIADRENALKQSRESLDLQDREIKASRFSCEQKIKASADRLRDSLAKDCPLQTDLELKDPPVVKEPTVEPENENILRED